MRAHAPQPILTVVAAITRNGVIGNDGDLVWRNRDDLQRLKARTMGHTLVMGRKNFDSIGRPLPGRRTVVVTRDSEWHHDGVQVAHDTHDGLAATLSQIVMEAADPDVFIFGGGEIYRQLLPHSHAMELALVDAEIAGDVTFPRIDLIDWREAAREVFDDHSWVRYERVGQPARLGAP